MQLDLEPPKLGYRGNIRSRAKNALLKITAVAGAGVMFLSALAISLVVFVIALTVVLGFGAYFWWKTREMRRQMREASAGSSIIEGVVVREVLPREIKR
jgi:O-antigen/teichoic acid export membrane protein